ncbi:hypothetical protein [Treponema sp.]|uniref:hypothetical protein n=1 Tax=Treponema sp. TaxID=166 RepID=UPI00298DB3EC|nr:hypothetical protein [Treponema sp.]MCR5614483.1 SpoIIIAH-like family protein [Treponema sp.]
MIKKILIAFALFACVQTFSFAQNFDTITKIIDTTEITNAQAAYLAASYMSLSNDRTSENQAFELLKQKGYFSENDKADDAISLKCLCSLFAKTLNVKGGLFYSVSKKSPRYTFKEFVARGYIPLHIDPDSKVSGADALGLFNSLTENATEDAK